MTALWRQVGQLPGVGVAGLGWGERGREVGRGRGQGCFQGSLMDGVGVSRQIKIGQNIDRIGDGRRFRDVRNEGDGLVVAQGVGNEDGTACLVGGLVAGDGEGGGLRLETGD